MGKQKERCDKCKWYFPDREADDIGECHRNPPTLCGVELITPDGRQRITAQSNWPAVDGDEFCGEFKEEWLCGNIRLGPIERHDE